MTDKHAKINFTFKETETDNSTYMNRATAMMKVTNPKLWFVSDFEVDVSVWNVKE